MQKNNISYISKPTSRISQRTSPLTAYLREWAIVGLFCLLTVLLLFPLSVNLTNMLPMPSDDALLNVWRMQWNARAFLSGPDGIANLFNTNIFYPFPLTLAYSEHFLMETWLAFPFLLIADSHLFGMNLSVLLTFILSGYAMYLLVSDWTANRGAGLVAGVLFAFSPYRFGQLNHLELLVTQWLPLALLALHWTLTRRGWRYPFLFALFFNLQALSGFHYALNLAIACVLLVIVYALTRRIEWRRGLWLAAGLSILVTMLLNWPIWRMYLRFSDVMGAVRTPGEVRIYSAALTDYLTAIPYNFLYGWTFGRWQVEGHQFQPLMPVGLVGLVFAVVSFLIFRRPRTISATNTQHPIRNTHHPTYALPTIIFLLMLTLLGLILSFGLNEEALGPAFAPLLEWSPYLWLYKNVSIFQGIRVPGRYGILVVLGLVGLAGWGVAHVATLRWSSAPVTSRQSPVTNYQLPITIYQLLPLFLLPLILVEYWSVPLRGPEFPTGQHIPPVYHWLHQETPAETVLLELPFKDISEFTYEYYATHHWRRLANGGSGFTPPIYKELRQRFNQFPDPRAVDVIQQLGIDLVILHPNAYESGAWQRVMADLPLYLPQVRQVNQVGQALVLQMAEPACRTESELISPTFSAAQMDGLSNAVAVSYLNSGPAAFVADVNQVSRLMFGEGVADKNFTEPLVTPAGEAQAVIVPLRAGQRLVDLSGAWLATLERTVPAETSAPSPPADVAEEKAWLPLGLKFTAGPQLLAYALVPEAPTACGHLNVALNWQGGQAGDTAVVQLLDPFGRLVFEDFAQPWPDASENNLDLRRIPLVGSLPAGRYGLRVRVYAADGQERLPITGEGVAIPADQIPPLPLTIHPRGVPSEAVGSAAKVLFDDTIHFLGGHLAQATVASGDWLRFQLIWQIEQPVETDLTVFTQLIGPDGQLWGQRDNQPKGGWYPTSLWRPGQAIADDYAFVVQPEAPPGVYRLIAGLYHSDTLERLTTPDGADYVEIGAVVVE